MDKALTLAEQGLGRVWPNPSVGCLLVLNEEIIAVGNTQPGGRPHAEVVALNNAKVSPRNATAYVSLEPCAHFGKTPPCADALIKAGISRCVVALIDPDPRVNGKGLQRLKAAGVQVELGLRAEQAAQINAGFFLRVKTGRPWVTSCPRDILEDVGQKHDAILWTPPETTGLWALVKGTGVNPVRWWLGPPPPLGAQAWRQFRCPIQGPTTAPADTLGILGSMGITRVVMDNKDPFCKLAYQNELIDETI